MIKKVLKKIYFGFLLLLFLLSLCLFCLLIKFHFLGKDEEIKERVFNRYQSLNINIKTNERSFGVVSIPNKIKEGSSIFKKYSEEKYQLISRFGTEEYRCSGSCYCDNEERRTYSKLLSKGLVFLVATVPSIFAIDLAKKYYDEECADQFSDSCNVESIRSEVDDCVSIHEEEENEDGEISDEKSGVRKYYCEGHCIANTFRYREVDKNKHYFGDDTCERYKGKGFVELSEELELLMIPRSHTLMSDLELAAKKFESQTLRGICHYVALDIFLSTIKESKSEFIMKKIGPFMFDRMKKKPIQKVPCVSSIAGSTNKSILCRRVGLK